jgi:hypothetical protein
MIKNWDEPISERRRSAILHQGWRVSRNIEKGGAPTRTAMEARNLLHLLDLKAAGHSPSRTELVIPNERSA